MNVLFLEDRGSTAFFVERWLRENGHNVLSAFNPNDAQTYWNKRNEIPIDCIILDLQVPSNGLTDEQKMRSNGVTLTGWIWLSDNILKMFPNMRQRTIIYSDYTYVLYEKIEEEELNGIAIIPKKQRSSSAEDVVSRIRKIARLPNL